ncbi:MAG: phage tail protein, partial [Patescibacteria group bacterium]|nr:phage tail protein [Patescibacteria group bacterium]
MPPRQDLGLVHSGSAWKRISYSTYQAAYPTLATGEYVYDASGQQYVLSASDGGKTVTGTLTYQPNYRFATELYVIPSSSPYKVTVAHGGYQQIKKADGSTSNSVIFQQDAGVAYYPSGTALTTTSTPPSGDSGSPAAAGEYNWIGSGGYGTYAFNAADAGKEVVIRYMYLDPDYDSFASLFSLALEFAAGVQGQSASAFMESQHPDQSVGYSLTALVEGDDAYLGMAGVMPNYSYEALGIGIVGGGVIDADPVKCAELLLTDPLIGVGFPAGSIDQGSWYNNGASADNWVAANEFYISQAIQNPTAAAAVIGRWLGAFNIGAVWSEGLLKLIPLGDQNIGSYVADVSVAATLNDDSFLAAGNGEDPVRMTRSPWADAYNRVQVSYKSRINSYNDDLVYEQDEASVERYGLRIKGADSLDFISTWQLASAVANMALKRLVSVRNSFEFSLPTTYEYLEPGDLVAISDSRLGLSGKLVRITKIVNTPPDAQRQRGALAITAEDFPGNGYGMPVANPKAETPANHPTQGTSPAGDTEAIIVQASNASPSQQGSRLYIWCRGKDAATWAGCAVYYSLDGTNFQQLGVAASPAPVYDLIASLPSVTPSPSGSLDLTHDTGSTLSVAPAVTGAPVVSTIGLSGWYPTTSYAQGDSVSYDGAPWIARQANSGVVPTDASPYWQRVTSPATATAAPAAVTDAAASALFNLAAVVASSGGSPTAIEFLSFSGVAAGSHAGYAVSYDLSDLYRGALGSSIGSFAAGSKMVEFAAASVQWDIPAGLAGQTVYFKFVAWNQGGFSSQTLDEAPEVQFVIADAGGAGVWEGLGSPIGDVIRSNAGSGELVVNPAGGVSGNLPYTNHAAAVTSGLTTTGNFQSGRYLGGDSGVQALGGSSRLGLGRTPTIYAQEFAGDTTVFSANPQIALIDSGAGGAPVSWNSTGGALQEWLNSAQRRTVNPTGTGFGRTPSAYQVEAAGDFYLNATSPTFHAEDTGVGGVQGAWNSNGGVVGIFRAGTQRQWVNGSGTGLEGTPSYSLDVFASGLVHTQGTSSAFSAHDRSAGGDFTLYRDGTTRIYDGSASADVLNINSSGEMGLAGSTPVSGYPLSHAGVGIVDSGSALNPGLAMTGLALNIGQVHNRVNAGLDASGVVQLAVPYTYHDAAIKAVISSGSQLTVNPTGGVSGLLPYANHASEFTAIINTSTEIVETAVIHGKALALGTVHDYVHTTISGNGLIGLGSVAMQVGADGTIKISNSGVNQGYQIRRLVHTEYLSSANSGGTANDGDRIWFASADRPGGNTDKFLLDDSTAAFKSFNASPNVALFAVNPPAGLTLLYATPDSDQATYPSTKCFIMNAKANSSPTTASLESASFTTAGGDVTGSGVTVPAG